MLNTFFTQTLKQREKVVQNFLGHCLRERDEKDIKNQALFNESFKKRSWLKVWLFILLREFQKKIKLLREFRKKIFPYVLRIMIF